MWTAKNRGRYDRSKLRYPSDLTDVNSTCAKSRKVTIDRKARKIASRVRSNKGSSKRREYVGEELTDPENPDAPRGITAYLVHVARNHPQTMRPHATSSAIATGSTVLPSRAEYEPWVSATSPSRQARHGRTVLPRG